MKTNWCEYVKETEQVGWLHSQPDHAFLAFRSLAHRTIFGFLIYKRKIVTFCVAFLSLPFLHLKRNNEGLSIQFRNHFLNDLPVFGGTNPYPLAPTITPLVSARFGSGPGGKRIGPKKN